MDALEITAAAKFADAQFAGRAPFVDAGAEVDNAIDHGLLGRRLLLAGIREQKDGAVRCVRLGL